MKVLVGCEESQAVCKAFRALGIEAYSCDLQECSGGHPEWHFQMDVFKAIRGGLLVTQSGELIEVINWDIGIFFPDCTYITVSANKWLKDQPERKSGTLVGAARREARENALKFVARLMNCGIPHIAIENPIGVIGSRIFWYSGEYGAERWEVFPTDITNGGRTPDQIIQPWMFGHGETKATCLWLTNLPKLFWSKTATLFDKKTTVKGREQRLHRLPPKADRAKIRSKTFPGIAEQMAIQWSEYVSIKLKKQIPHAHSSKEDKE